MGGLKYTMNANVPQTNSITAGLRGATWDPERMTGRDTGRIVSLVTEDNAFCMGVLYGDNSSNCVVVAQHPREFISNHYLIPFVLDSGAAFFVQAPRSVGSDLRLEHEQSLYEVAAGIRFLRQEGFRKIVLLGNSGGASLYSYYNEQSLLEPGKRITRSPTGRPTKFKEADFPQVDGLVFVSPHPGQGILLMNGIDPSVADESDPFSTIRALDPFDTANGFVRPPGSSSYSNEFISKYKEAQRNRVARLDEWAKEAIRMRQDARRNLKRERSRVNMIHAAYRPVRTVWRTDADLRCFDLSLDPSHRSYGSLWGGNPVASNYGSVGFGRLVTPDSWLSSWSGLSSKAELARTLPSAEQDSLMLVFDRDNSVFPAESQLLFDAIGTSDKTRIDLSGDHHGRLDGGRDGQVAAGLAIAQWLGDSGFLN